MRERSERGSTGRIAAALGLATSVVTILATLGVKTDVFGGGSDAEGDSKTEETSSVETTRPGGVTVSLPSVEVPKLGRAIEETAITLSQSSGEVGTAVAISGEGFARGETVVLRFATEEVGRTKADSRGRFDQEFRIPERYAPEGSDASSRQYSVTATGQSSSNKATASFTVTVPKKRTTDDKPTPTLDL